MLEKLRFPSMLCCLSTLFAPKEFTLKHTLLLKWSVVRKVNSAIYPVVISFETFKIYSVTGKAFIRVYSEASSRLKTLFIPSEFSISNVIAFYAFLWQLKKLLWSVLDSFRITGTGAC